MSKNKGRNAFFYFMQDWRRSQEKKGHRYDSLQEVQSDPNCSEAWKVQRTVRTNTILSNKSCTRKNLHPQKKGQFEAMAKRSKCEAKQIKRTTLGESILELQQQKIAEEQFKERMENYMDSMIHLAKQENSLHKLKFYFIHVNWFYRREVENTPGDFCPAEFAVAEFTMEHGVSRFYHEVIYIKSAPGYTREALESSQNSHKIPLELANGQKDFSHMYDELIKFLRPEDNAHKLPPLFTLDTFNTLPVRNAAHSFLRKISEAKGYVYHDTEFVLYPVDLLFAKLYNAAARSESQVNIELTMTLVVNQFSKDTYRYASGLECEFHKRIEGTSQYCSLSVCKRWGFTICDYCFNELGMDRIPGVHLPELETNVDSIENGFEDLSVRDGNMMSMTGVTEEHRIKTSERSYREEQYRRKTSTSVTFIDHSKNNEPKKEPNKTPKYPQYPEPAPIKERPLRLPRSAGFAETMDNQVPDMNDRNFPVIGGGRGIILGDRYARPGTRGRSNRH